ncbi:MAG: cysteine--tRNA ligase [Thermoleophilia bacterium]
MIQLYDSLNQQKSDFMPRDGDHVTMYFCGPTVYNYIHLGNARPFVISMVAKRYFESLGYRVTLVENITDIDDRIIQKAQAEGRTAAEVAAEFAKAYIEDTDALGLGRPDVEPYATEHIPEIIDLVEKLVEAGHAYQSGADVYYDVDSFPGYGRLSKQQTAEMRHGARITPGEDKDDPLDFALWKGAKPGEPAWDSPWGQGRPGWHIECSAMSLKYLGAGFDIHGGGRDLIFPHHENEMAQAEGALGGTFVRYWVHNGMLNIRDEKMSKSVGNIFQLRQALQEYRPEVLIAFFVSSHYRSPMDFSRELLEEAGHQVWRLRNLFRALEHAIAEDGGGAVAAASLVADDEEAAGVPPKLAPTSDGDLATLAAARRAAFDAALADDLNTAGALGEVFALAREVNSALAAGSVSAAAASALREDLGSMVYILGLDAAMRVDDAVPSDVLEMAARRQASRAARDFAEADRLRDAILARGFEVRDAPDGYKVVPAE